MDAGFGSRPWSGLDGDLDVLAEHEEETHQALDRESRETASKKRRDFGLIDREELGSRDLREVFLLDEGSNLGRKFRFGESFFGVGDRQVAEYVAGAGGVVGTTFLDDHRYARYSIH